MIEQRELARLVGGFESDPVKAEGVHKAVREAAVQLAFAIEQTDSLGRLPRFDYQLDCTGFQPSIPLRYELLDDAASERAAVFLAQLELDFQTLLTRHRDYRARLEIHVGEAFAALDSRHAHVRAQLEICG